MGVSFPATSLAWTTAKIIPTQLISSAGDFLIFYLTYLHPDQRKTSGGYSWMVSDALQHRQILH
jgi:hypothetical protein